MHKTKHCHSYNFLTVPKFIIHGDKERKSHTHFKQNDVSLLIELCFDDIFDVVVQLHLKLFPIKNKNTKNKQYNV